MALGPNDLIVSHYTLTGADVLAPARFPFAERVAAAAGAGFAAIGLQGEDYRAAVDAGADPKDLRRMADDHGVTVAELEFVYDWHAAGDRAVAARAMEENMYEMADLFGSRHMNVGVLDPPGTLPPLELVAERFGAMCDRAAEHDLLVAFEFLPWTAVPDVATAWRIVEAAGRANGGILVDSWHHFRGANDNAALQAVAAQHIVAIQLDDADAEQVGELAEDTMLRRRLPGQGSFDLPGLIRLLDGMGVQAPLSVELMSAELQALDAPDAARQVFDAMTAVVAAARP